MIDVIPHSAPGATRGRPSRRSRSSQHVLKVDWKLPARLRKPVRQQFIAEKRAKQKKTAGGFARRELNTRDMYRDSGPEVRLVAPPYVGRVMRGKMHEMAPVNLHPRPFSEPAPIPAEPTFTPKEESSSTSGVIKVPKRRLKLPFSINLIPKGLFGSTHRQELVKKKIFSLDRNIAILLIGCLVSSGVIWNLQGLGRGWGVLGKVEEQSAQALEKLGVAQAALASSDFVGSEAAFADANQQLAAAQAQLDGALSTSRTAVQLLDVTGTVRSGQALLQAAEELTRAGQHISRTLAGATAASPIQSIETAKQELTVAESLLGQAEENLKQVTSSLLPEEIVRASAQLSKMIPRVRAGLNQFLKQSDLLLTVLGAERDRQYLLLFANNHELRPVGGFLGSLALINIDRGKVENIDVQSIYDGDGQLKEFIAPPDPLLSIVDRWYLRDSNWFVDFPVSARKAADFFEKEGGPTVDGVLLMTPEVIKNLLQVSGPIVVPGYAATVASDNFTEVTQREVTYEYDRTVNRPKQFLADLTPLLLNRLLSGQGNLQAVSALTESLAKKDLLLFFRDQEGQKQVEKLGWGGNIPKDVPGFLYVNNANIGGHKSDQFVDQEIDYRTDVKSDGDVEVVLTIRRSHRGPSEAGGYKYPSGEDPTQKDNIVYQRVLVPRGAQLVEARGFSSENDVPRKIPLDRNHAASPDGDIAEWQRGQTKHESGTDVGQEAGYTFFANWMITRPGATTVGLYRYVISNGAKVPGVLDAAARFSTYVAKQPGAARTSLRAAVTLPDSARIVKTAPDSGITRESDREFVYRGELTHDVVLGAVYGK